MQTPVHPFMRALMRPALLPAFAALLGGCSLISPAPTWELVKAAGSAAHMAVSGTGAKASNTVYHLHAAPAEVCIEFNPDAQVADILPALQLELKTHGVNSRVYAPGSSSPACTHWLRYVAFVDWDSQAFDDEKRLYMRHAALTLYLADGHVLSQSEYRVGDGMFSGKWAPTRKKLAPVVTALITGFEN